MNDPYKNKMELIIRHYEVEKELASRIRNAPKTDRHFLYAQIREEFYQRFPHFSLLSASEEEIATSAQSQMCFLRPFLRSDMHFLEVGPGRCGLAFEVAKYVKYVYVVDVSGETKELLKSPPDNFEFVVSDGVRIPQPENTFDLAYSHQVMEHIHPDDALEQLININNVLKPDGLYICITPNSVCGPHDISKHFDDVATGFHFKEYTNSELHEIFKIAGFRKVVSYVYARGIIIVLPLFVIRLVENILLRVPSRLRKTISNTRLVALLLGIYIVGKKT